MCDHLGPLEARHPPHTINSCYHITSLIMIGFAETGVLLTVQYFKVRFGTIMNLTGRKKVNKTYINLFFFHANMIQYVCIFIFENIQATPSAPNIPRHGLYEGFYCWASAGPKRPRSPLGEALKITSGIIPPASDFLPWP